MVEESWSTYLRWNQALCDVIFTGDPGTAAYLDMDDDVLAAVAREVGVDAAETVEQLAAAVRATLDLSHSRSVFDQHLARLEEWRRGAGAARAAREQAQTASRCWAARCVHLGSRGDGGRAEYRPHAYYPRLCDLLAVHGTAVRNGLESAYRRDAETLWRGLNEWLSATDGKYGVPTAYAISHRYVGLPSRMRWFEPQTAAVSRLCLGQFGLPPALRWRRWTMVPLLDQWIQQSPSPASRSMQSLWRHGGAQERIATVAALELLHWDGGVDSPDSGGRDSAGEIGLLALLRRFPQAQVEISFVAQLRTPDLPRNLLVMSSDGQPELDVVPAAGDVYVLAVLTRSTLARLSKGY